MREVSGEYQLLADPRREARFAHVEWEAQTERDKVAVFERSPGVSSLIDVLDRVLDKGIVIDGRARVSLVGIDLMTADGWFVVASIGTYLRCAEPLA